jgi:GT2 family glycosyltransferase
LLLNSDTIVLDNAIAETVAFAESHPETAVVGCKVLNPDGSLQRSCFLYPSALNMFLLATYLSKVFPRNKFFGREEMTWWDFDEVSEVEAVCGCFSMIRKEAIDDVGVMDPAYFVYGDDPDWCIRFRKAGWRVMFTPIARIIHFGGQNTKQMKRVFKLQLFGAKLIFIRFHKSRLSFPFACIATSLFGLIRIPYWLLRGFASLKSTEVRREAFEEAGTCFLLWYRSLFNWRRLLMNAKSVGMSL